MIILGGCRFVGVYGVGGSGKTSLCKFMLSFYNKELYPGSCCFIQFPSREEDESQLLVQSIKDILSGRGGWDKEFLDKINSVEQILPQLQKLLERYKVFLVLDNIWDWALQRAKQILKMDCLLGSRLLLTARSEGVLQNLSLSREIHVNEAVGRLGAMQIVHVPSISEEEAIETLTAYSFTSHVDVEDLRGLVRSCFFGEYCHPLLLNAVGTKLRHLGGHRHRGQLMSHLQIHRIHDYEEIEDTVVNVLKSSFDALHRKLQGTFLKLGTCIPKDDEYRSLQGSSEWLSRLSNWAYEDTREQLVELEYHGLIQIHRGDNIVIHDLHMKLIENIVRENNGSPRCFFYEGDVGTLSERDWRRLRYIHGYMGENTDVEIFNPNCPDMEVLHLEGGCVSDGRQMPCLSLEHMQSLRYLQLKYVSSLQELGGWHGAPNLVSVQLIECKSLKKMESMACLHRLECLEFIYLSESCCTGHELHWSGSRENLKRLVIWGNPRLINHGSLGHLPKLRELDLSWCRNWVEYGQGTLAAFTSLESCILRGTGIRKFLLDFKYSIKLRVLDLSCCKQLQSIEGSVSGLTALEELLFSECPNLESIPNLEPLLKLRSLQVDSCFSLREVKVGDGALTSLESLGIEDGCRISMSWSSPALINNNIPAIGAFTNLRALRWHGSAYITSIIVDVGSTLPLSLETLFLKNFESLEEITGLGHLTKLVKLSILRCGSLRKVGHWEAPFISNLSYVFISECPKLESLSTMRHLTSLKHFRMISCPKVQTDTLPPVCDFILI